MRSDYSVVKGLLDEYPWDEDFISGLIDLESDFKKYLYESLKSKNKWVDPKETDDWKKYMKWWEDSRYFEEQISKKFLGETVSVDSLLKKCYDMIYNLFCDDSSFYDALDKWYIKNFILHCGIILPSDAQTPPEAGSWAWFEKKISTNKNYLLLISTLRRFWIFTNDLVVVRWTHSDKNSLRVYPYCAIYIDKLKKTLFFNPWYGEATFVCDGMVPIDVMTSYWKEKIQSELSAKRIKFFENDIDSWKNALESALFCNQTDNVWKNIGSLSMKSLEKDVAIQNLIDFYKDHKDDSFDVKLDDDTVLKVSVKDVFSTHTKYVEKYKYLSNQFPLIYFPWDVKHTFWLTRNEFRAKLWLEINHEFWKFSSSQEIIDFYNDHDADDDAIIKKMFSSYSSYKWIDKSYFKTKYKVYLPDDIDTSLYSIFWVKTFEEIQVKLNILNPILFDKKSIIQFYKDHQSDKLVKDLFDKYDSYSDLLSAVNQEYKVTLPSLKKLKWIFWTKPDGSKRTILASWNDIKRALGIVELSLRWEMPTMDEIIKFYDINKSDPDVVACFYSTENYRKFYKSINEKYSFNLPWSTWDDWLRKIFWVKSWNDVQKKLWIPITRRTNLSTPSEIVKIYKLFSDDPIISELFSSTANYQKLVREVNSSDRYRIMIGNWENSDRTNDENNVVILQLPVSPKDLREKFGVSSWSELRENLWIVE